MGKGDALRILLFVTAAGAVYFAALRVLVSRIRRRLRHEPDTATRSRRLAGHAVLGVAVLGLGCVAWAFLVEPYQLTVTRVRMTSARLPKGSQPIRVVHITDLHCDDKPRLEERLPDAIAAEKPDLVVFTGDAINSPGGLPIFRRCITRIAAIAPTFAVEGNWDVWYYRGADRFSRTGVRMPGDHAEHVNIRGIDVWIAGVAADAPSRAARALADVPPGALTLLLHHYPYPDVVPEADRGRVDLMCAGHVHGGQVALPLFGAIVTLSRLGKQYEHGLYEVGPMHLFVSRGIGMEGGWAPRVRFCAPPEIAVIDIAPQ